MDYSSKHKMKKYKTSTKKTKEKIFATLCEGGKDA